jgi:outer membrane protein OmpA-like peptidoglycan-associated protein
MTAVSPALAQVTVDLHALQALPENKATSHRTPPVAPQTRVEIKRVAPLPTAMAPSSGTAAPGPSQASTAVAPKTAPSTAAATAPAGTHPATPPPTATMPALPDRVPQTATIAPVAPPVAPPPVAPVAIPSGSPPPAPPPVSANGITTATPTSSGLRLIFASGQSDLSSDSVASIKKLADATPQTDATTFNVLAYAPGKPDDPSTARRTSLSRAMAVRSALVADGVPSAHIFVRALGDPHGNGPADRVDISVTGVTTDAPEKAIKAQ